MLLREATVSYSGKRIEGSAQVASAADVYRVCRDFETTTVEHFVVLHLNVKHRVISRQTVAIGSVASVDVHPREVFRVAVMIGASAVIVVHNHPSGEAAPSVEDNALTRRLVDCGKLLGIKVLDHVVIGDGEFISLAETVAELFS